MNAPNIPVWSDGSSLGLPPLRGEIWADTVVVGLGASGLAAVLDLLARKKTVVGIEAGHELTRERRRPAPLGQTEERPRPFAETLDQASFRQQSQMPRDAGLRLAQDGGEIRHGELRLPQ
jgi:choline dehydrogenase-like flavoprotein